MLVRRANERSRSRQDRDQSVNDHVRLAEKDEHTAIVRGVPVEECPACGQVWLTMETAVRLDGLVNQ